MTAEDNNAPEENAVLSSLKRLFPMDSLYDSERTLLEEYRRGQKWLVDVAYRQEEALLACHNHHDCSLKCTVLDRGWLDDAWLVARREGLFKRSPDGKGVSFPICLDEEVFPDHQAVMYRQEGFRQPWKVAKILPIEEGLGTFVPKRDIDGWAEISEPEWKELLDRLSELSGPNFAEYTPLQKKNYVNLTWCKLQYEGKIATNGLSWYGTGDEGRPQAAFNTGLLTRDGFREIYAWFAMGDAGDGRYKFVDVCCEGSERYEEMKRSVGSIPERASYFERLDDVLFDPDREMLVNYRHVVIDNLQRFPIEFLRREFAYLVGQGSDIPRLFEEVCAASSRTRESGEDADLQDYEQKLAKLKAEVQGDRPLYMSLCNRVDGVIADALRTCRRDARAAVPAYDSAGRQTVMLLPLDYMFDNIIDDALVVVIAHPIKRNLGVTMYTPEFAFLTARLITAPSGWLARENLRPESAYLLEPKSDWRGKRELDAPEG